MINKIVFLNDHWILLVILIAVALLIVFALKEWAQSASRRIILKLSLAFLAISCLALIALKPALPTTETFGKVVLLTEGYNEDQLDSLKKEHRILKVLEYNSKEPISNEIESAEMVFVLGNGIKDFDLWQLENSPVTFLSGDSVDGIIQLKFSQGNRVGDSLVLQGIYRNPRPGNRVVLKDAGGVGVDSLAFNAEGDQDFKLAAVLKVFGNFIYSLAEKDSDGEVVRTDPVPVKVAEREKLKILIINSFPTFETKYLKNFLAEAGHEVVVRSRITRGRFIYEYLNTDRIPIGNLSESTLEPFDLFITDAGSWRSLAGGQATALENSVRQHGLGLFIQPDDSFLRSPGKLANFDFEREQQSEIGFPQWPGIKLKKFPYRINGEMGLLNIHTRGNSAVSAYKKIGEGRIGTTVLADTWQLVLEGNTEAYRQLWSRIVEQVSRKKDAAAEWEQEAIIAYQHEPFNFKLRTSITDPEIFTEKGNRIPMAQDINFSNLWSGTTWPREIGWNKMQQDTIFSFSYYVAQEEAWNSLRIVQTLTNNRRFFSREEIRRQGQKALEPINPLWLFGLFLLCMGGLWLEPKV